MAEAKIAEGKRERGWLDTAMDAAGYARKAYSYLTSGDAEGAEYKAFKELVRKAVSEGESFGKGVNEASLSELLKDGAWGKWQDDQVYVPVVSDIPRIFGGLYDEIVDGVARYRMDEAGLKKATQDYLAVHEIVEAALKPKDHDKYEATLLRALKDLGKEGLEEAREAYIAAAATYKVRKKAGDRMLDKVGNYMKELKEDVSWMFGAEGAKAAPAAAMA